MAVYEYIKALQSYEEYAFSWEELIQNTGAPESTLRKELRRLSARKEVLRLRNKFYVIIPPRYQIYGKIPVKLFIDKLFKCLGKQYYVAFYSAAAFYGASHQRLQKDYVMTEPPVLQDINKENFQIDFFKTTRWPPKNVIQKESDAGSFQISSPAFTSVDLIYHQSAIGGLNRVITVLKELVEEITLEDLKELLSWYPLKSVLQRFGFMLEEVNADKELIQSVFEHLQEEKYYPVLLKYKKGEKPGKAANKWKVDINHKFESDL